eukprot:m.73224 g.73224  ORF g.73224 m.73224 type:complete len:81 (-) comp13882_c1_seq1:1707-1949(-)
MRQGLHDKAEKLKLLLLLVFFCCLLETEAPPCISFWLLDLYLWRLICATCFFSRLLVHLFICPSTHLSICPSIYLAVDFP